MSDELQLGNPCPPPNPTPPPPLPSSPPSLPPPSPPVPPCVCFNTQENELTGEARAASNHGRRPGVPVARLWAVQGPCVGRAVGVVQSLVKKDLAWALGGPMVANPMQW